MQNLLQKDVDITNLSNFKTKAKTKYYYEINNINDVFNLKEIINFSKENNLKLLFVGAGTNLLFAFEEFNGIVIKNNLKGFAYDKNLKILEIYSSESIWEISEKLENDFEQNLWHRFIGLPGSIGGAIFGNAGCFGLETENNISETEVYNLETGKIERLNKDSCKFGYRNSLFKQSEKYFIIKAKFDLSVLVEKYFSDVDNIKYREEVQPKGNSCGSFFKNHSKEFSAGKLIEEVGLKGFTHNTAYFSQKHANFLMTNCDNGNYKDLIYLVSLAKTKVMEKFGFELQEEVRIIKS
ncbi:MAG: UDP-N-acetylmuramate dehydrogenase [Candidatus Gracilibacteria bacterium]|nr:UDP-N-acetylmuramate dehydrogenase [Candidatus Gracilibacteria bacterium]